MKRTSYGFRVWRTLYHKLLLLLPGEFRQEMGSDMRQTFRDSYDAELRGGGHAAAWWFGTTACFRIIVCSLRMRLGWSTELQPDKSMNQSRSHPFRHLAHDVRVAIRGFVRTPGFSITSILIIGLGVGSTTAVFTIVDRVLLRVLPYPEADRLVYFAEPSHSAPDFLDWRERTDAFERIVASRVLGFDLTSEERPERVRTAIVSDGFFSLFGASPVIGTLFDEFPRDGTQPVVISHDLWGSLLGSDPDVVGRRLILNGEPVVITGVMNPGFQLPEPMVGRDVDAWRPLDLQDTTLLHRGRFTLQAAARLSGTTSMEGAQAQLNLLGEALANEHPDRYRREDGSVRTKRVIPLQEATVSEVSSTLLMLLGAVGMMLLIACANVANLFLARGTDRQREMTLRLALGAGARRIAGQLLTETIVLAGLGGMLGVGLAQISVSLFVRTNPVGVPRLNGATIDLRVLGFALATSVLTGIIFGIVPAIQASRANAAAVLKEGSRGSAGRRTRRFRNALVVVEIALALILVTGATVLFDGLLSLRRVDPGISVERVIAVPIGLSSKTPEERAVFSRDVIESIRALPGVEAVGAGVTIPFAVTGGGRCCWFMDFNRPGTAQAEEPAVVHPVTEDYFNALGASLIRGRNLTARDGLLEPLPVVLNAKMARSLFGESDPMDQAMDMDGTALQVVGVVNDIRHWGLNEPVENEVYFPFSPNGEYFFRYYLAIRTGAPSSSLAPRIRDAIWSVDPNIPLPAVSPMTDWVEDSYATSRFYSTLLAGFASLALALAAAGIYGSMLYSVGQQYREIGVRLAIGARPLDVTRLVILRATALTVMGLGIGLVGTQLLRRTIDHLMVGTEVRDAPALLAAVLLLGLVALSASYLPARKASRADPLETLRAD